MGKYIPSRLFFNYFLIISLISILLFSSCKKNLTKPTQTEIWKLGWRMVENLMDENPEIAELQFDSLLNVTENLELKFLTSGLEIKSELGKEEEIDRILKSQKAEVLQEVCINEFLKKNHYCKKITEEKVKNKILQMELIKMYVDDQAVRGNVMQDMISKYELNVDSVFLEDAVLVDERNRNRLKEIFEKVGFPDKAMVGKDAMKGVFFMIQHSDGDKEWQKSQFSNIEKAVKNGDLDGQSFAYLYDRIRVNNGEKQLYGTQFKKILVEQKIVELVDIEDVARLDERRMEVGMMPIEMYKRLIIKMRSK